MNKPTVAVVKCPDYEAGHLADALARCFELTGGRQAFPKPGSRVFVKVNLLSPDSPVEKAIATHPMFSGEVLRALLDHGLRITVGDDFSSNPKDGSALAAYRAICQEAGVRLVNLKETGFAKIAVRGRVLSEVYIARPVLEADALINLPKLKTHSFTAYTGAVKNLFGLIPRGLRCDYHRQFVRNEVFSQALVDIYSAVPPHLSLMDAITGMEGEGPSAGRPKHIGLILASRDAVALDAAAARIVGYDPLQVLTTRWGHERGLGVGDVRRLEVTGERLKDISVADFKHSVVAVWLLQKRLPSFLYAYLQSQLTLIPQVMAERCNGCFECVRICPVGAASRAGRTARVAEKACIHCLCCHEVCAHGAIRLKQLPLGRAMRGGSQLAGRLRRALKP